MLITRHCELEQHHWSSEYETTAYKPLGPRMSDFGRPLSSQPDWQGQYSCPRPGDGNAVRQPFERAPGSRRNNDVAMHLSPASVQASTSGNFVKHEQDLTTPSITQHPLPESLGLRVPKVESPVQQQAEAPSEAYDIGRGSPSEDLHRLTEASSNLKDLDWKSASLAAKVQDVSLSEQMTEELTQCKEEKDDILDDDEIPDAESESAPQTAAERTAARRKMKRFRLTHQQTRFLMSEFAKQPHPDAAHRERLSREIPGLSPRQVQVWFQNRRAKIKRLTVDDRERMIKMRAVPDDFDNIQALHSPYGAVHALGTPMTPSVDFVHPQYAADHMMRSLVVDARRGDGQEHVSPTGLGPAFGEMGFAAPGPMNSSDLISPLSPASNERNYYSTMNSPMGSGPNSAIPFVRQNSLDTSLPMHAPALRQQARPLQPLQLREMLSRSRPDNIESPLRSSMSWKGDAIDYTYQGGNGPASVGGRQHSVYQQEQMSSTPTSSLSYDSSCYSTPGLRTPFSQMNFSNTLQQASQNGPRLRAASATLPLALDLRNQYRSAWSTHEMPPQATSAPQTASTNPYESSAPYSTTIPSAPLTAPVDFQRSRADVVRTTGREYATPQMSAPVAAPQDFSQALHATVASGNARTPIRENFAEGGQTQELVGRTGDYPQGSFNEPGSDPRLKRSFSFSPSGLNSSSQPYSRPAWSDHP